MIGATDPDRQVFPRGDGLPVGPRFLLRWKNSTSVWTVIQADVAEKRFRQGGAGRMPIAPSALLFDRRLEVLVQRVKLVDPLLVGFHPIPQVLKFVLPSRK